MAPTNNCPQVCQYDWPFVTRRFGNFPKDPRIAGWLTSVALCASGVYHVGFVLLLNRDTMYSNSNSYSYSYSYLDSIRFEAPGNWQWDLLLFLVDKHQSRSGFPCWSSDMYHSHSTRILNSWVQFKALRCRSKRKPKPEIERAREQLVSLFAISKHPTILFECNRLM